MVTTVPLGPLDQAVIDVLAGGQTWPVGYGEVPDGGGWQGEPGDSPFREYLIVDPDPAGYMPTLASAQAFTDGEWRVRAVSLQPGRARAKADEIRTALLTVPIVADGFAVIDVRSVTSTGPRRDEQVIPTLFYALEVVAIQAAATT